MLTGIVKHFIEAKGFGCILCGGRGERKEYFLHKNYMQPGQDLPKKGDLVEFDEYLVKSKNPLERDRAINVRIITRATR